MDIVLQQSYRYSTDRFIVNPDDFILLLTVLNSIH